jgi:hypothetical protein
MGTISTVGKKMKKFYFAEFTMSSKLKWKGRVEVNPLMQTRTKKSSSKELDFIRFSTICGYGVEKIRIFCVRFELVAFCASWFPPSGFAVLNDSYQG